VVQCLNEQYSDQLIGHGDSQNWPTWLPDLTVVDFHVWGNVKNMVYECKVKRREELLHLSFYAEGCMNDLDVPLNGSNCCEF
jgi:hypothetical protein